MTPTLPMQSGTSPTPDGNESAVPQSPNAAGKLEQEPKVRIKRTSRKSRKVWEAAPNGIDHAILLVGLGSVVLVMLFVIIRAVVASHN